MATHSCILAWKTPWTAMAGYSPWNHTESDTTEQFHFTVFINLSAPMTTLAIHFFFKLISETHTLLAGCLSHWQLLQLLLLALYPHIFLDLSESPGLGL